MNFLVKYKSEVPKILQFLELRSRNLISFLYFTKTFVLYQKIRTILKYSYFTENFVLYQKIRTPDEQVLLHFQLV